ncbi:MAG: SLBB domain-containing protein [Gemmatimonadaceae bacterium]|nr:SLBB domain-containing protein [Gemmatimonadaceae bacterium]
MRCLLFALLVIALPGTVSAQSAPLAGAQRATRTELAEWAQQLDAQIASEGKTDQRNKLQAEKAAIRARLESGDFRVGDRFLFTVRFDSVRTDTASVRDSLKVSLLNLPDVSLKGVLRSELAAHLEAHVSRFVRNVEVRANVLTRVAILGAVARPGYYYAAPDRPLSDLVMLAGGPAPNANLKQLEITRGRTRMLSAKDSRKFIEEGRTLEQLDVQSGDEVRIPDKKRVNWQLVIQLFFILSSFAFAAVNFLRWYYERQE